MRNWIGSLGLAVVLAGAGFAATGATVNVSDADLAKKITHEIRIYPSYSIWDNVSFRVENGEVALVGGVSQPFKKADLGRIVQQVAGVRGLTNDLKVLPLSSMDDRLRLQVAHAIYGDPSLSRYGAGALPSIHVIVDNGAVTLEGVVGNDMDKQIAGMRASAAGLSFGPVVNNLKVEGSTRG